MYQNSKAVQSSPKSLIRKSDLSPPQPLQIAQSTSSAASVQQVSCHLVSPTPQTQIAKTSTQKQLANLDPQLRVLLETAFIELGKNKRELMDELAKKMQPYLREHKLFRDDYFRAELTAIILSLIHI